MLGRARSAWTATPAQIGRAVGTADLQIDGMLHGKILRSTLPHVRMTAIDVSAAAAMLGTRLSHRSRSRGTRSRDMNCSFATRPCWPSTRCATSGSRLQQSPRSTRPRLTGRWSAFAPEYEPPPALMTVEQSLAADAVLVV